jgi:hypothetical protein
MSSVNVRYMVDNVDAAAGTTKLRLSRGLRRHAASSTASSGLSVLPFHRHSEESVFVKAGCGKV